MKKGESLILVHRVPVASEQLDKLKGDKTS